MSNENLVLGKLDLSTICLRAFIMCLMYSNIHIMQSVDVETKTLFVNGRTAYGKYSYFFLSNGGL